jgi:hypothetical protein
VDFSSSRARLLTLASRDGTFRFPDHGNRKFESVAHPLIASLTPPGAAMLAKQRYVELRSAATIHDNGRSQWHRTPLNGDWVNLRKS